MRQWQEAPEDVPPPCPKDRRGAHAAPCIPFEEESPLWNNFLTKWPGQLDALDEASLLALWDKYAVIVSHFEPTKRWEEAALVFSVHSGQAVEKPVVQLQLVGAGASRCGVTAVAEPDCFLDPPTGRPAPAKPKRKAAIIQFRPHRSPEKDASEEPGGKG